jgi:hypothetical protein
MGQIIPLHTLQGTGRHETGDRGWNKGDEGNRRHMLVKGSIRAALRDLIQIS